MRLMGRKRSREEYEVEGEQTEEDSVEEVLEAGVFQKKTLEEAEEVEEEAGEAKEPWVVRGEAWLQAVKLEKQVSSY